MKKTKISRLAAMAAVTAVAVSSSAQSSVAGALALRPTNIVEQTYTAQLQEYGYDADPIDAKIIWDFFIEKGYTPQGTAGLIGNLAAESNLRSTNLEDSKEWQLGIDDLTYTEWVDQGIYTNFAGDSGGYGIAQWTSWSRKQRLLEYVSSRIRNGFKTSIGNANAQLEFLYWELQQYSYVDSVLRRTNSLKDATDCVLTKFESPADIGDRVKDYRAALSLSYFNALSGGAPAEPAAPAAGTSGTSASFKVNERAYYSGTTQHLYAADTGSGVPCRPAEVIITDYYNIGGARYCYHAVSDDRNIFGWIDPAYLSKLGSEPQVTVPEEPAAPAVPETPISPVITEPPAATEPEPSEQITIPELPEESTALVPVQLSDIYIGQKLIYMGDRHYTSSYYGSTWLPVIAGAEIEVTNINYASYAAQPVHGRDYSGNSGVYGWLELDKLFIAGKAPSAETVPAEPDIPEIPAVPEVPAEPDIPETPVAPVIPEVPETPVQPVQEIKEFYTDQVIWFSGSRHYPTSWSSYSEGLLTSPGWVRVTFVNTDSSAPMKYHCVSADGSTNTFGWLETEYLSTLPRE
ncbi:MAG: hypothetical protein IJ874_06735 [Ruminococcus sp.]|nr:hypothetical protein [Ruminococcus sp.]